MALLQLCLFNLYKQNICLFWTWEFVPNWFGLDRVHCTLNISLSSPCWKSVRMIILIVTSKFKFTVVSQNIFISPVFGLQNIFISPVLGLQNIFISPVFVFDVSGTSVITLVRLPKHQCSSKLYNTAHSWCLMISITWKTDNIYIYVFKMINVRSRTK